MTTEMRGETTSRHAARGAAALHWREGSISSTTPGVAPLSFAQERIWFLEQLEPALSVYNIPCSFRVIGPLDIAALERGINEIVRRHSVLRTTFGTIDGEPRQTIAPSLRIVVSIRNLETLPENERAGEAAHLAAVEAARPFDLARGPLVRAVLLRLAAEEHVLVVTTHHIVSEGGWSTNIFLHELGVLYDAYKREEGSPLAELPMRYADYASWQREQLHGDVLERELAYWKERLAGAPPLLELPADRSRPAVQSYRGAREKRVLARQLSERLRALSRTEDVTVTMTLLAAWLVVVSRYTGQEDLVIGMPITSRPRLELERLIGMFMNTLALRVDVSGNPSFRELLARVRDVSLGAYAHQILPFERLVGALRPERARNHAPIVQVMFAPQPTAEAPFELAGVDVRQLEISAGATITDVMLFSWDEPGGIRFMLEYCTDLFEAGRMRRMLQHYQTILASVVSDPTQRLSALPLLTDAERYQLLAEWSSEERDWPRDRCIHELVATQAALTPRSTALVIDNEMLTYGELNRRANQLAHHLRAMGVGADVLVGIAVERSLEMVIGLLGILKAGGAYLPLDPAYPRERLAFMLSDSGIRVLLTQQQLHERLPAFDGTPVYLDTGWDAIARQSTEDPPSNAGIANLAYVIYTSGSTGRPKGVQIPHGALVNLLSAARELVKPTHEDTLLAVTTLSFDIAGLELWLPLMVGARIVLASSPTACDGARLATLLDRTQATIMQATPATWQLLLHSGWTGGSGLKVLCGGEALSWKLASQLRATGCTLWNMYGPTETTIWSAAHPVDISHRDAAMARGIVPIGRPLANTELYVLDGRGQLVPVGVPGELYIGGAGLARGYHNRPDLTTSRFVPHPFSSKPGERLYRTGDQVRYRDDGVLEFLGRIDQQVKLRGHRIELGEIEAVLRVHPAVRDAVVVLHDDEARGPMLAAYVTLQPDGKPLLSELRAHAQERLPRYMIPSVIIPVDALPMTPGGKVDRRALPAPELDRTDAPDEHLAPRDELESQLATLWERALAVSPIGMRDNFFDLGGHSLLAARLFRDMERTLGRRLPLAALLEAPTIEGLAALIRRDANPIHWPSLVPIQPNGEKPPLICVHGGGGNVVGYQSLAHRLGPSQPCYGLQAQGLNGDTVPSTRVEEMAANYIAELRAIWPNGPFALCGLSFGGTVAFEMACQLSAQGQPVALVALFDSHPFYEDWKTSGEDLYRRLAHLGGVVGFHVHTLGSLSPLEMLSYTRAQIRTHIRRTRSMLWRCRYRMYQRHRRPGESLPSTLQSVAESCAMAFRQYRPQPYPGRLTLFRAAVRGAGEGDDPTLGWGQLAAGGVEIHEVPGSHVTMIDEPHVARLAEDLSACLARAYAIPVTPAAMASSCAPPSPACESI